jgi:hypothetical protein
MPSQKKRASAPKGRSKGTREIRESKLPKFELAQLRGSSDPSLTSQLGM